MSSPSARAGRTTGTTCGLGSICNQGKQNLQAPTESALNILARVRKTPRSVQREIYEALKRTFGEA